MWSVLNALLALMAVSISLAGAWIETPACAVASNGFNTCIESDDSLDACITLYDDLLAKCNSGDVQNCGVATLEFLGLGCGGADGENDPSCDEVQSNIELYCTQEELDLLASISK